MRLIYLLIIVLISACNTPTNPITTDVTDQLVQGVWRGILQIDESNPQKVLPFNFEVVSNQKIIIKNGEEKIEVTDVIIDSQSILIQMPVFDSEFKLENKGDTWEGYWYNNNKKDYKIPFSAIANTEVRFEKSVVDKKQSLAKRWKVMFSPGTEDAYPAIGLFEVDEKGKATGTFLTETGDYRFLEGQFDGSLLALSCFDGSHAFLFEARLDEEGNLKGDFWSGKHWHEPWSATPDQDFQLTKMETLTFLKDGYDKLAFSLPDVDSNVITLADTRFQGKPIIVQVTGTWCPNCMDETRFFVDLYEKYHPKGLEIIAIDFEAVDDFEVFKRNVKRTQKDLGVQYPMVYGGYAKKSVAAETLPMLNHIMSYPTAIFIDRDGNVKEIHTGFAGPSTGDLYQKYTQKTIDLVESML